MSMTEHYPLLTIVGTLLLALLIMAMAGVTWWFDVRLARLPQATRLEDLTQRNSALIGQITENQAELAEIQRRILDRDRIAAEVAALTHQLEAVRAEMAAMADTELQIEELKRRAADTALQDAEIRQQLEARKAEKEAVESALKAAEDQLAGLPNNIGALRRDVEQLRGARQQLEGELAELRNDRATLTAAREETVLLTARKAALEEELTRITAQHEKQRAARAGLEAGLATMLEQKRALQADIAVLQPLRAEAQALAADRAQLMRENERFRDERQGLAGTLGEAKAAVADAQQELTELQANIGDLQKIRQEVEALAACKAALELEIKKAQGQLGGPGPAADDDGDDDLRRLPACLAIHGTTPRPVQEESAAIEEVRKNLSQHGLQYHPRTVDAFHTSLKINEVAQLTVLAGVSGTGKSLLPRRYAEAMGMSFLPMAVEPRWDSPQDLLGFYNYVEKRYRATDLARALVHMDPHNTSGLCGEPLGDRMLLVLLDEMNLARVEYYFSEFLSRLEIRPRWSADIGLEARHQAAMPLDTRGRKGGSVPLFPSHNVLFVGTMNDDESTLSLSDKVLDRSNVLQFPAPATFDPVGNERIVQTRSADGQIDFRNWRKWIRGSDRIDHTEAQKVQQVINRLADIMRRCGRPFGHRLNEAVMAYVVNHPKSTAGKLRIEEALADQVEFRILPKLRGVMIDEGDNGRALEDIVALLRGDLHDSGFANHLRDMLSCSISQFNWRGLDRNRS
ncbi:AAA family ATPase [Siccirubricoccus sp. G192]|uniref:AAA family ATPase n=1 Tax=Siccirubricoccus sp. G192 TaxID=2849651 RepID=UPI001C2C416D|nr:AAA family ATPase [Siccirubricoccus sp. G192]MBV1800495.1 AAA family ATPase [Siccirubricoccus sp. G192]